MVLIGYVLRVNHVFLQHMPLPVVFPWEGFRAMPRIVAPGLGAVKFSGLVMLVVDVSLQVCDGTKAQIAPRLVACERPVVIAFVVIELVVRVLHGATIWADPTSGRPSWRPPWGRPWRRTLG